MTSTVQSNPLDEENMQEVMGVGGDYEREEYEVRWRAALRSRSEQARGSTRGRVRELRI